MSNLDRNEENIEEIYTDNLSDLSVSDIKSYNSNFSDSDELCFAQQRNHPRVMQLSCESESDNEDAINVQSSNSQISIFHQLYLT